MRWYVKPKPSYRDERIIRRFLLFPKGINGQWRWLETAYINQKYLYFGSIADFKWSDVAWVDAGKENEK